MAADSNIGYECLNTGNIQQPENAGFRVVTWQTASWKNGEVWEAAEGKPSTSVLWGSMDES